MDKLRVHLAHAVGAAGAHAQRQQGDDQLDDELAHGPQHLLWVRCGRYAAATAAAAAAAAHHPPACSQEDIERPLCIFMSNKQCANSTQNLSNSSGQGMGVMQRRGSSRCSSTAAPACTGQATPTHVHFQTWVLWHVLQAGVNARYKALPGLVLHDCSHTDQVLQCIHHSVRDAQRQMTSCWWPKSACIG